MRKEIHIRQPNTKNKTQQQLLLRLQLQVPYHRHRHQKDPHIRNQIRDVGKVRELDEVQTLSLDIAVPEGLDRATDETERDGDADTPGDDEDGGGEDEFAKERDDEDAVVEGEDAEFDADEGDVVEVAEDVVALGVSVSMEVGEMCWRGGGTFRTMVKSSGATAMTCRPMPWGGPDCSSAFQYIYNVLTGRSVPYPNPLAHCPIRQIYSKS